jgi:tetratricopeptide (TPR) repeat protein
VARHIDRKQLKSPDQFVSFWTRAGLFVTAHKTLVIGGSVGVLALALALWGGSSLFEERAAKASYAFARIERVATADLLDAPGEPPKTDDRLPHFKTEQERLEAALKEADGFVRAYGRSRLKDEALLLKAKYLLTLGKAGEAASVYQSLVTGSLDRRLRFLAQEGLGYALEQNGQLDQAITSFGALADDAQKAGGFYRDHALFNKARLLQKKSGGSQEAGKLLREILDKSPTTALREEINDRLAALEGK